MSWLLIPGKGSPVLTSDGLLSWTSLALDLFLLGRRLFFQSCYSISSPGISYSWCLLSCLSNLCWVYNTNFPLWVICHSKVFTKMGSVSFSLSLPHWYSRTLQQPAHFHNHPSVDIGFIWEDLRAAYILAQPGFSANCDIWVWRINKITNFCTFILYFFTLWKLTIRIVVFFGFHFLFRMCWVRMFTNWIQFRCLYQIMSLILSSKGSNDFFAFVCDVSWYVNRFHNIQNKNPGKNKDFILMISIVYIDDFPRRKLSYQIQLYSIFVDRGSYIQSKSLWLLFSL